MISILVPTMCLHRIEQVTRRILHPKTGINRGISML
jgi:hypothetical protein